VKRSVAEALITAALIGNVAVIVYLTVRLSH
jgi:hypothetical protein